MTLPHYPLEQLAHIKKKKLEEAERELNEKKEALNKEFEQLKKVEHVRDEALELKETKLQQLRDEMDRASRTDILQRMKSYLKLVDEDLDMKEGKVKEQQKKVDAAKKAMEEARALFFQRQKDVEKLKLHRKEWEEQMRMAMARGEEAVTDEIGSAMHIIKKTGRLPRMSVRKKQGREKKHG